MTQDPQCSSLVAYPDVLCFEWHGHPIQNGPRRLKQIKALHWQTHARGSFDHQRLFGALANRITLKCRLASGRRLGMAINGGNGQR
jgi:hypothetical protein